MNTLQAKNYLLLLLFPPILNRVIYHLPGVFQKLIFTIVKPAETEEGLHCPAVACAFQLQAKAGGIFYSYLKDNTPTDNVSFSEKITSIRDSVLAEKFPIHHGLFDNFKYIFEYFDDWVVVVPEESGLRFMLRKKADEHVETIEWVN